MKSETLTLRYQKSF